MTADTEHGRLVDRMATLRAFIARGDAYLRTATPSENTVKIAQAITAAQREHDALRERAIAVRPKDWLPG